jgi:hypothetical protein
VPPQQLVPPERVDSLVVQQLGECVMTIVHVPCSLYRLCDFVDVGVSWVIRAQLLWFDDQT